MTGSGGSVWVIGVSFLEQELKTIENNRINKTLKEFEINFILFDFQNYGHHD